MGQVRYCFPENGLVSVYTNLGFIQQPDKREMLFATFRSQVKGQVANSNQCRYDCMKLPVHGPKHGPVAADDTLFKPSLL